MNPRQRRGALLLIVAVVGAIGVIGAIAGYVSNVQSQLGPMRTVLRLSADVEQLEPVGDRIEEVEVPERWAPEAALTSVDEVMNLVAAADMPAGTLLQQGALEPAPEIAPSQREFAILVSPETGVGGKIRAGDTVDIYATYAAEGDAPARSELVLQSVPIIDIAPAVEKSDPESGFATDTAVPVTFAVSADHALVLAYAESFATEVRLGLRTAADTELIPPERQRFGLGEVLVAGGTP